MPCTKLSQKRKVFLKFEWEHFMLLFVMRKSCICGFAEVLSPQKIIRSVNCKSTQTAKKYVVRKSQIRKLPNLQKVRKLKKISPQIWFAKLICGPPTLPNIHIYVHIFSWIRLSCIHSVRRCWPKLDDEISALECNFVCKKNNFYWFRPKSNHVCLADCAA
jgi:hypothetical protein